MQERISSRCRLLHTAFHLIKWSALQAPDHRPRSVALDTPADQHSLNSTCNRIHTCHVRLWAPIRTDRPIPDPDTVLLRHLHRSSSSSNSSPEFRPTVPIVPCRQPVRAHDLFRLTWDHLHLILDILQVLIIHLLNYLLS